MRSIDGRGAIAAVLLAAAGAAAVGVLALLGAFDRADGPEATGPIADVFAVNTWEWDGRSGMDALVSGRLAFTDTGCTLLVAGEGEARTATAVFFPNASGVRYENGVRGVVDRAGRVFAVEGEEFSYAGGWVEPASAELIAAWDARCAATPLRDAVVVNDAAARPPLDDVPAMPAGNLPTAPSTAVELGWFPVPTFEWDPVEGGDAALVGGTVTFLGQCPVIEADGAVTGLILPNAEGFRQPDGALSVYAWFPDGSSGLMVMDGEEVSYGGGYGPPDARWTELCPTVDQVAWVYDRPFG